MGSVVSLSEKRKKNREKHGKLEAPEQLREALKELRYRVEHQGDGSKLQLVGGIYRKRNLYDLIAVKVPPWIFGYSVREINGMTGLFHRTIFIKLPGEQLDDLAEHERKPVFVAVYDELLDKQAGPVTFSVVNFDCVRLTQQFYVAFRHEFKPNLIVPGKKG